MTGKTGIWASLARTLIAVLLFCNAVSPGVCATLCNAHVCCRFMQEQGPKRLACCAKAEPDCCPMCKRAHSASGYTVASTHQADCCTWIGKKVSPPAAFHGHMAFVADHSPAILPAVFDWTLPTTARPSFEAISFDDRAPPGRPTPPSSPRAPPAA